MNKFFQNLFALTFASLIVGGSTYLLKDKILNYYANSLDSLYKTNNLQSDLESGKIIVFGSSELLNIKQKFIPQNFFNNDLQIPLRVHGNEGHQEFAIMSQLAAYDNNAVRENAKVVIMLSPSWFTGTSDNGTRISKFLEFMYTGMMSKLYFQSTADKEFKLAVDSYIRKNIDLIKDPTYIYSQTYEQLRQSDTCLDRLTKKIIMNYIDYKNTNIQKIDYIAPKLDWESLRVEAKNVALPSTNNNFGISNEYYSRYVEPSIQKGEFPFNIILSSELDTNQEYQDFLMLLKLLKNYKIKPLFVMQDLHPSIFVNNRESMNKLVSKIKSDVLEYGYDYYDMWSYDEKNFEVGSLVDMVHLGELGWLRVDQKIIEHFMSPKGN